MSDEVDLNDQIRGVAMAVRHWFEVTELEDLQRSVGINSPARPKNPADKKLQVLAFTALPPQIVRLKPNSPMVTLHYMQDIYDDGRLRADPWRWWFAWVSIELIARLGPDRKGSMVRRFLREDPSLQQVRNNAARWLACNPQRLAMVQETLSGQVARIAAAADSPGRTIDERVLRGVEHLDLTLLDTMADEAARIAAALSLRLEERARRA